MSDVKEYEVTLVRTTDDGVIRHKKLIAAISRANAVRTMLQTIDRSRDLEFLYRHFQENLFNQTLFNADIRDHVVEMKIRQSSSIKETVVTIEADDYSTFPTHSEIIIRLTDLGVEI